ncbi:uncharacterized protein LOC144576636 [Callithrix jacchus]
MKEERTQARPLRRAARTLPRQRRNRRAGHRAAPARRPWAPPLLASPARPAHWPDRPGRREQGGRSPGWEEPRGVPKSRSVKAGARRFPRALGFRVSTWDFSVPRLRFRPAAWTGLPAHVRSLACSSALPPLDCEAPWSLTSSGR